MIKLIDFFGFINNATACAYLSYFAFSETACGNQCFRMTVNMSVEFKAF